MKLIKGNARLQVALLLAALLIVTAAHLPLPDVIVMILLTHVGTLLFDMLFQWIRFRSIRVPYSAMVTGLILTLLIDPAAQWWQMLGIAAFAMAGKHYIRIKRHIFNPAALGLMLGWLAFGLNPSWWGASFYRGDGLNLIGNFLLVAIVAGIIYVSAWRMKRYYTVGSFLIASTVLAVMTPPISLAAITGVLFSMGILFFGGTMVPEPMTSPIKRERQILFGIAVALVNTILVFIFASGLLSPDFNVPDSSLVALLLANALFFKFR